MNNTAKNIIVGTIAFGVTGIAVYFIQRWDDRVMDDINRYGTSSDTSVYRPTESEQRIARQFSNTTLPQLKQLGLITLYTRTEIETVISVSGTLWNKRSSFFKESLLENIFIYNSVNGFAVNTKIVDDKTNQLYAQIIPPDGRIVYQ